MRTRNGRTHAYVVKHPYKGPLAPSRQKNTSCAFCPLAPHLIRALCLFPFGFTSRRARRANILPLPRLVVDYSARSMSFVQRGPRKRSWRFGVLDEYYSDI